MGPHPGASVSGRAIVRSGVGAPVAIDVGVELVGPLLEGLRLAPRPLRRQCLLLGGSCLLASTGGPSIGLRSLFVGLQLARPSLVSVLACLLRRCSTCCALPRFAIAAAMTTKMTTTTMMAMMIPVSMVDLPVSAPLLPGAGAPDTQVPARPAPLAQVADVRTGPSEIA